MATLSKIGTQFRLRFQVYLPAGVTLDRSRRYATRKIAKDKAARAELLEIRTRRLDYTATEINEWIREGLLSKKDAAQLHSSAAGGKSLTAAVDEYRETWPPGISKGERAGREGRLIRILAYWGEKKPIIDIQYMDGVRFRTWLADQPQRCGKKPQKGQKPKKLKAVTINKHLQDLRRLFRIQKIARALEFNPFSELEGLKIPKEEKQHHVALSFDQIQVVIEPGPESAIRPPGRPWAVPSPFIYSFFLAPASAKKGPSCHHSTAKPSSAGSCIIFHFAASRHGSTTPATSTPPASFPTIHFTHCKSLFSLTRDRGFFS